MTRAPDAFAPRALSGRPIEELTLAYERLELE